MTVSVDARFDDLDDPSPPRSSATHRVEVDRRIRRFRRRRQLMVGGLAVAIVFGATFTAVNLRTPAPTTKALKAASSSGPDQVYWPSAGTPGIGSAPPVLPPLGPSTGNQDDAAGTTATAGAGTGAGEPSSSALAPQDSLPGMTSTPCANPTWEAGSYCGPSPHPGNGAAPDGRCSGRETAPPCGPGAVVGTYYAYTLPVRCDGTITFDGRRWESDLLPPSTGPDLWVWMRLAPGGHLRSVSPVGTVGFTVGTGHASPTCSGAP
ncbi:MAG TPA: hypothetical protein VHU85_11515 [Acidimicrobiales bacterium]|nr:hypothetical protein [Acidimicrobiales bacterium]